MENKDNKIANLQRENAKLKENIKNLVNAEAKMNICYKA